MSNFERVQASTKKQRKRKNCVVRGIIRRLCEKNGVDSLGNVWKENHEDLQNIRIRTLEKLEEFLGTYPQCFNLLKPGFHAKNNRDGGGSRDSPPEVGSLGLCIIGKPLAELEVEVTTEPFLCEKNSKQSELCQDRCGKLHICKFFMLSGLCSFAPCRYSHDIKSRHNCKILRDHLMDHLSIDKLRVLFTRPKARTTVTRPFVCRYYNKSFCKKGSYCPGLHMCEKFLLGSCEDECGLNHDIVDVDVGRHLEQFAVQPEDLADILWDNMPANPAPFDTFRYFNPSLKKNAAYFQNMSVIGGLVRKQKQELYSMTNGGETREHNSVSRPFHTDDNSVTSSPGLVNVDAQPVGNSTRKETSQMVSTGWGAPATNFHSSPPGCALQITPPPSALQSHSYTGSKRRSSAEAEEHNLEKAAKELEISGVVGRLLDLNKKLFSFPPDLASTYVAKPDVMEFQANMESETRQEHLNSRLEPRKKDVSDGEITESEGEITDSLPEDETVANGSTGRLDVKLHNGILQASRNCSSLKNGNWEVSSKEGSKEYKDKPVAKDKEKVHGRRNQSTRFGQRKKLHLTASWDYKRRRGKMSAAQDGKITSSGMDRSDTFVSSHHPEGMHPEDFGNFNRRGAEIKCQSLLNVAGEDGKDFNHPPSEKDVQEADSGHFASETARQRTWQRGVWKTTPQSCKSVTTRKNHTYRWSSHYGQMVRRRGNKKKKKDEPSSISHMGCHPQNQAKVTKHRRELSESRRIGLSDSMLRRNKSVSPVARLGRRLSSERRSLSPNGRRQNNGQLFALTRESPRDQSPGGLGDWQGVDRRPRERNKIRGFASRKLREDFVEGSGCNSSQDTSLTVEPWQGSENAEERRAFEDEKSYGSHRKWSRLSENKAERDREAENESLHVSYHRRNRSSENTEKNEGHAEERLDVFQRNWNRSSAKRQATNMREVRGSARHGGISDPWLFDSFSQSSRFSCHSKSQDGEACDDKTMHSQETFDCEIMHQEPRCQLNQDFHASDRSVNREDLDESRREESGRKHNRHSYRVYTSRSSGTQVVCNGEEPMEFQGESVEGEPRGGSFERGRRASSDNPASLWNRGRGDGKMKVRSGTNYKDYSRTSSRARQGEVRPSDRVVNANKQHGTYDELHKAEEDGSFSQGAEKEDWSQWGSGEQTGDSRPEALAEVEFDEGVYYKSNKQDEGRQRGKKFANYDDWKRAFGRAPDNKFIMDGQRPDGLGKGDRESETKREPWHGGKNTGVGENEYRPRHRRSLRERTCASVESRSPGHHRSGRSRFRDGSRGKAMNETDVNDRNNNFMEPDFDGPGDHGYYRSDPEIGKGCQNSRHGPDDRDPFLHSNKGFGGDDQNDENDQDRSICEDGLVTDHFAHENQPGNVPASQRQRWAQREMLEIPDEDNLFVPPDQDFWDKSSSSRQEQSWSGQEDEDTCTEGQPETHSSKIGSEDLRHRLKRKRKMPREREALSTKRKKNTMQQVSYKNYDRWVTVRFK